MAETLRASDRGLETIERAMRRKGWTKTRTPLWWQEAYTTQATIRRFWRRIPIQRESFIGICQAVGVENWEAMVERHPLSQLPIQQKEDWGEAPDVSHFYGRTVELDCLQGWIVRQPCKLIAVFGMGGIGKTSLAVRLVEQIRDNFNYTIWRSLLGTPPLPQLLESLIHFISDGRDKLESENIHTGISQLIGHMQQQRCLLVLDEVETLLSPGEETSRRQTVPTSSYVRGYESYGELFRRIGSDRHQSCLLLNSREKLGDIATFEGESFSVRCFQLSGLEPESAKALFVANGFVGNEPGLNEIIDLYAGNPLAIKAIATMVREVFNGNIAEFLSQNTLVLGDRLRALLKQHVNRLSSLERELAYWMAIEGNPISFDGLYENLLLDPPRSRVFEALVALERRSILDKTTDGNSVLFTLQPLVKKYVLEEFIDRALDELDEVLETRDIQAFKVLKSHSLLKQENRVLRRLIETLKRIFDSEYGEILEALSEILPVFCDDYSGATGYLSENCRLILKAL